MNTLTTKKIYIIGLVSLALGALFDFLFYDKQIGISFFIYVALLLAGLFSFLFYFKVSYDKYITWFLPAILFFAVMVGVRDNMFLIFWNIIMTVALLLLLAHQMIGQKIKNNLFLDYFKTAVLLPLNMLGKSFNALGRMISVEKGTKENQKNSQITKGILITLPIVLFFLFLLSSADLVFKKLVSNLFNFSIDPVVMSQIGLALAFAFLWLGVYAYILENVNKNNNLLLTPNVRRYKFGNIEAGILFSTLNVLFLSFVVIQIKYLFAGHSAITQLGFTYADYAHKGFGELIAVALLTFTLIFLAERYIERSEKKPSLLFKILTGILMMLVLVIMASAFTRLGIYEEAYGFTLLRILVQAFIIWLAAIFLWLAYKIIKDVEDRPFIFGLFLLVIAFFVVFNLLNPDVFVARKNINQFVKTGALDTKYLANLSADAVPSLIPLLEMPGVTDKYGNKLSGEVAIALKGYHDSVINQSWQSYNVSRNRAIGIINSKWDLISTLAAQNSSQGDLEPKRVILAGEYVCLTSEPSIATECIKGLKTEDGKYYVLDFNLVSQTVPVFVVGDKLEGSGVFTPIERLNTDQWQKFSVIGIFSVTDSIKKINSKPIGYPCNSDGKICEDGSVVGRTGSDCAFSACPMVDAKSAKIVTTLGQITTALNVSLTPKKIVSDSRCPSDVQCIWAGTVEVQTVMATKIAHGEQVFKLGEPKTFGEFQITLIEVAPGPKSSEKISESSYRLTYEIIRL